MRGFVIHAYNVVYYEGRPMLVDVQNPVIVKVDEKRIEVPYIVPIVGFDPESKRFILDEKYDVGRTYRIEGELQGPKSMLEILSDFGF